MRRRLERRLWRDLFDLNSEEARPRIDELQRAEDLINNHLSDRLLHQAQILDIEAPGRSEFGMWAPSKLQSGLSVECLSPKGRACLRKLIDEEKTRRRQVKAWWVTNVIVPVGTLAVGILGALAALFAILHKE